MASKYSKQNLYDVEGLVAVVTGGTSPFERKQYHDQQ